jgi:hypothetical protein
VFPVLIVAILSALISNFTSFLFETSLYDICSKETIDRFITIIAVQLMIIYVIVISLRMLKKNETGKNALAVAEWMLISSVLVISIIIGAFLEMLSLEGISHGSRRYLVFSLAGIILINVVVCYLVVDLEKKNMAMCENELLHLQQEYNKQYVKNADTEYDLIRKMRHDFRDNYSALYTLLADGNVQSAKQHIEKHLDNLVKTETFVRTENDIVNAVINSKLSAARSFGIEATCLSISDFHEIDDIDLCRLLSNMLENAITACNSSQREVKQIYLKISSDEYKYIFNLKNTIDASVLKKNPTLKTTKKEKILLSEYGVNLIRKWIIIDCTIAEGLNISNRELHDVLVEALTAYGVNGKPNSVQSVKAFVEFE